jgi:phosphate transport system ATP-binding protein
MMQTTSTSDQTTAPTVAASNGSIPGADQGPPVLIAQNVSAWFGKRKVLDDVSLAVPSHAVTALIGPSGCGKSTFLRILNRMHELIPGAALSGTVKLDGTDIYGGDLRPSQTRQRVGMVFQKPNPFPSMSIYDNVLAGLKLTGTKCDDKDGLVEWALRRSSLWTEVKDRLRTPGGSLSGGQQQRLCIARSLAVKPQILLMDEPCSALDPTSTRRVEDTIREILDEVTVVIVTHNMQQAQRCSDQTAFFLVDETRPGHIVEAGKTEQVFSNPIDPRTNDYVNGRFG